jgi:very-short-patch-repair endonuclease
MSDQVHIQGMLNVAFTRARDEVHIFHSAPVESFAFAGGRPGALTDWLRHCAEVEATPRSKLARSRIGKVDSEFEAAVGAALRDRGLRVLHQYPSCGFNIDLVAESEEHGLRVAVECDGERYHQDEHGLLKIEDIERQAILERAGWRVLRIPYRKWLADPAEETEKVVAALERALPEDDEDDGDDWDDEGAGGQEYEGQRAGGRMPTGGGITLSPSAASTREWVTEEGAALINALKEGRSAEEDLFIRVRDLLGRQRLTQRLRLSLQVAAAELARRKLIAIEDGEYFALPAAREATLVTDSTSFTGRRRSYRRGW